jgi:hypothetical protein
MLLTLAMLATAACAQEKSRETGGVEEVGPTTVYLKDENGQLVPVPGITYERFRELLLLEARGAADPPPAVIDQLSLSGDIRGDVAELTADVTITCQRPVWHQVPLRLTRAALTGRIVLKDRSSDDQFVHRYEPAAGHTLWIKPSAKRMMGGSIKLTLPLTLKVTTAGFEKQLALVLPKTSETKIELDLPADAESVAVKSGEGVLEVSEESSHAVVVGAAGDVTLAWQSDARPSERRGDALVTSEIVATVRESRSIEYVAKFTVREPSAQTKTLWVQLPEGADLTPSDVRGLQVSIVDGDDLPAVRERFGLTTSGRVVQVDALASQSLTEFTLLATGALADEADHALQGFRVLGIPRQEGVVALKLPTGSSFVPLTAEGLVRIDPIRIAGDDATASYRFFRQPFQLKFESQRQPARLIVEPTYVVLVNPEVAILTGSLDFQVRGPKPEAVEIFLGDWVLDSVSPGDLATIESHGTAESPARLNLEGSTSNSFSLQLSMHRPLAADATEVSFATPRAVASQVTPAVLSVISAENVRLTPLTAEMRGLVAEARPAAIAATTSSPALHYRELGSKVEPLRFVAEMEVRRRQVAVEVDGVATPSGDVCSLEQRLALHVDYEPLEVLTLVAPLDHIQGLRVLQNGRPQTLQPESLAVEAAEHAREQRWRVTLPKPILGDDELVLRYQVQLPASKTGRLPLVLPVADAQCGITRQQFRLATNSDDEWKLNSAANGAIPHTDTAAGEQEALSWTQPQARVEISRTNRPERAGGQLRIERQWTQVWAGTAARRDRLVARLGGGSRAIQIQLPTAVNADSVLVQINDEESDDWSVDDKVLTVSLPSKREGDCVLDLEYVGEGWSLPWGKATFELPRIRDARTPEQAYVQLLTPSDKVALLSSSSLMPQQRWRLDSPWLERRGALSSADLERWVGVAQDEEAPPVQCQETLAWCLADVSETNVFLCPAALLWLVSAATVLLATALVPLAAQWRGRIVLLGLALIAVVVASVNMELSLVLSKYVAVGVVFYLAARWSLRTGGGQRTGSVRSSVDRADASTRRLNPARQRELVGSSVRG